MTACADLSTNQTIPSESAVSIEDAVKTLNVSQEDFESFLADMNYTYDDYINHLTGLSKTLEDEKNYIEEKFDCTYDEYIKTVIAINNDTIPDSKDFAVFESKYSNYDAYIPRSELDDSLNKFKNRDISLEIADESNDAYAFDIISACNGDFATYMSAINSYYGCTSMSLTNMTLFGNHGTKKPANDNACMDKLFCYDDKTNDILEPIVMPVLTLSFDDDENKTITLALANKIGLIFKTTGFDSYEKMLKLSSLDFQIRNASLTPDDQTPENDSKSFTERTNDNEEN